VKMPQVDGHELLARIRKLGFKNAIVMLSGSGIANDIERAYENGANGYLVKPIRFDELVELLRDTCAFWLTANRLG